MQQLSQPENEALEQLKQVKTESIWGIAISNVIKSDEPQRFRYLICELKSQAADCPETMKNILGPAYDSVVNL